MSVLSSSRLLLGNGQALLEAEPSSKTLLFQIEEQKQTLWCWAAVGVSLASYYQLAPLSQCALASRLLKLDCCGSGDCDDELLLDDALGPKGVGVLAVACARVLDFDEVAAEINAKRPVAIRIALSGGGGHYIVLKGYDRPSQMLQLEDPSPGYGSKVCSYAEVVSGYRGDWTHSYTTHGM